jgi:hypothetical protein
MKLRYLAAMVASTVMSVLAVALTMVALMIAARPADPAPMPLVGPPQCDGKPDVGFCYLDLSDGREYVIYTDPITGNLAWYEQDWRDGS